MTSVFLKSASHISELPESNKPHIAMVGRSNVGKSSLINDLCNQKDLARVSAEPGRTQLMNFFEIDGRFLLVDLPGYGFAKASKEKRLGFSDMIHNYLWQVQQLKLVLLIIDARIGPTDLDHEMLHVLTTATIPFVMIANKIDKLSRSEATNLDRQLDAQFPGAMIIPHSLVTGAGKGEIRAIIDQAIR